MLYLHCVGVGNTRSPADQVEDVEDVGRAGMNSQFACTDTPVNMSCFSMSLPSMCGRRRLIEYEVKWHDMRVKARNAANVPTNREQDE